MKILLKICVITFSLVMLILFSSCMNLNQNKEVAEKAIQKFHENFNNQSFNEIYNNSDKEFKSKTSIEEFNKFISVVYSKLGPHISSESKMVSVTTGNMDTYIRVNQITKFKKGSGEELFIFSMHDKKLLLFNYNINSKDLIIN
ncbi:MAG: hypothetical protein IPM56_07385 [Ignavibacteriales bacterium]|nr:MAG: hypothetical protein IPM56_07385 [Ignavibacteriales bacterium]